MNEQIEHDSRLLAQRAVYRLARERFWYTANSNPAVRIFTPYSIKTTAELDAPQLWRTAWIGHTRKHQMYVIHVMVEGRYRNVSQAPSLAGALAAADLRNWEPITDALLNSTPEDSDERV